MSGTLSLLVSNYGLAFVFTGTLLSCVGLPIPAMLIFLAGGALAAANDSSLWPFFFAGYTGAIIGGGAVFAIGRTGGAKVVDRISVQPRWNRFIKNAHELVDRWGGGAVFIGSWLVAQLGPAISLVSGAGGLDWIRFNLWHLSGRVIWVGGYLLLGYVFADRLEEMESLSSFLSWAVIGVIAIVVLVVVLRRRLVPGSG